MWHSSLGRFAFFLKESIVKGIPFGELANLTIHVSSMIVGSVEEGVREEQGWDGSSTE